MVVVDGILTQAKDYNLFRELATSDRYKMESGVELGQVGGVAAIV